MQLIGFGFQSRTGKDTCCQYLVNHHSFKQYAFADKIKEMAHKIFGHLGVMPKAFYENAPVARQAHIIEMNCNVIDVWVGMNKLRDIYPKIWISLLFEQIRKDGNEDAKICISDVRQFNEIMAIKELGGSCGVVMRDVERVASATLDLELESHGGWDFELDNNGSLEDLYRQLDVVVDTNPIAKNLEAVFWGTEADIDDPSWVEGVTVKPEEGE